MVQRPTQGQVRGGGRVQRYRERHGVALVGGGVADGCRYRVGVVVDDGSGGDGVAQRQPVGRGAGRSQGDREGLVGFYIVISGGADRDGRRGVTSEDVQRSAGRLGTGEVVGIGGAVGQRPVQGQVHGGGMVQRCRELQGVALVGADVANGY